MKPGIYDDISNEDYHAGVGVSCSQVKKMLKNMAYAKCHMDKKINQTPSMLLGSVTHKKVLEANTFDDEYVVGKFDKRTTAGKLAAKQFAEEHKGKQVIDPETNETSSLIAASVHKHPIWNEMVIGQPEKSIFWEHEGMLLKCRPDMMTDDTIFDLKTTQDASPSAFQKTLGKYRYDIQVPFYLDGAQTINPNINRFIFVVVETSAPYNVAVYELDKDDISNARSVYFKALEQWQSSMEFDVYPGYSEDVITINTPKWI